MNSSFPRVPLLRSAALSAVLAAAAGVAQAQPQPFSPPPENVVELSSAATVEVPQDLLAFQLHVTREGSDPVQVQNQLKAALDQALAEARKTAQPGAMDVRTGNFAIGPRYARDGRISGWQGTAELVLEGTDFARIGQAAGRIPGMTVASSAFRLSRERRAQAERDAQAQAVADFRIKAAELAKSFGFQGFTLRQVSVQRSDEGFPPPRPRMMAMEAKAASDAPVPVEAGRSNVVVSVTGSVQLR
jgi:predicted secreted protein